MTVEREKYVPLSVRYGNRRKRLGWWIGTRRERLALRLAPWLKPRYGAYRAETRPMWRRCLCARDVDGERVRTHSECPVHSAPDWMWQS